MGGKSSKEETTNVAEQDNGFHMVEIHAPTMGLSIIAILIILAILALGHSCATRMRKRYFKRPRHFQHDRIPMTTQYPLFTTPEQYPYINMAMMGRNTPTASIHEIPATIHPPPSRVRQQRHAPTAETANNNGNAVTRKAESAVVAAGNEWSADNRIEG